MKPNRSTVTPAAACEPAVSEPAVSEPAAPADEGASPGACPPPISPAVAQRARRRWRSEAESPRGPNPPLHRPGFEDGHEGSTNAQPDGPHGGGNEALVLVHFSARAQSTTRLAQHVAEALPRRFCEARRVLLALESFGYDNGRSCGPRFSLEDGADSAAVEAAEAGFLTVGGDALPHKPEERRAAADGEEAAETAGEGNPRAPAQSVPRMLLAGVVVAACAWALSLRAGRRWPSPRSTAA